MAKPAKVLPFPRFIMPICHCILDDIMSVFFFILSNNRASLINVMSVTRARTEGVSWTDTLTSTVYSNFQNLIECL